MTLSIEEISKIDIREKDEEDLVQSVIDEKRSRFVSPLEIARDDIDTDNIQTPEDEARLQKIIDERVEAERLRREAFLGNTSEDDEEEFEEIAEDDVDAAIEKTDFFASPTEEKVDEVFAPKRRGGRPKGSKNKTTE